MSKHMSNDEEIFVRESERIQREGFIATLTLELRTALSLITHIQLATRHPGNRGPASEDATLIARAIQGAIALRSPELGRLLEQGWHPAYDVATK